MQPPNGSTGLDTVDGRIDSSDRDFGQLVGDMQRELAAAPDIYHPGEFWEKLIASHLKMLEADGIENFKRTVSNNYYNWLVTSPRDGQMRSVIKSWLRRPSLAPLLNSLGEPATGLRTMHSDGSFALSRTDTARYRFFVGGLWEMARHADKRGLTESLSEPEIGNPLRIRHRGKLISQDLANSIIEFSYIAESGVVRDGCRVAELGAGYGRLAHVFMRASNLTYCIFDIPPALAVAQWYLTALLGPTQVAPFAPAESFSEIEPRLRPGMVAFFTPNQLELFPDGWFDCMQTISTLPEMPLRQAHHYLSLFGAKARSVVFLKQWQQWRNEADDGELTERDYVFPSPWQLRARRQDPVQPEFINQVWMRPDVDPA
jgi:putative sugar O-methyltransferase